MKFLTPVPVKEADPKLTYDSELLLLGSCFANHIGGNLSYFQFKTTLNPFGILYHPKAILNLVNRALDGKYFEKKDVFLFQERWHSFETHSALSKRSAEELLTELNAQLEKIRECLSSASHLVLTLGTAWGYRHKKMNQWVANCHKVPQKEFDKELTAPQEIEADLHQIINSIKRTNPKISLWLTVSPVRHLKDGAVENQQAKAHLLTAIHKFLNDSEHQETYYFPAYEIMMDELRDYRFYEPDMIHPNSIAIAHIWERFQNHCISKDTLGVMEKVGEIQKGLAHKPFDPESTQYLLFKETLDKKIASLCASFPHMKF